MNPISKQNTGFTGGSDRLFRELVESSQELFYQVDLEGRYVYLNQAWEMMLGYPIPEMLGRFFFDFQPADARQRDLAIMAEFMTRPAFTKYETTLCHKDGTRVALVFSGKQVFGDDGHLLGVQGMGHDVTERKRSEDASRLSADQLRAFISNAPTAIAMFDTGLRYLAYSERWLVDYGLVGENLMGRHHYDVFPSIREHKEWRSVHSRALAGETMHMDEDTFIGADGRQEWLQWDVRPWRLGSGDIGGIIMLTESITARRRAEVELRASEERYRNLAEMGFEAIFIHENGIIIDLNTALVEILGYATPQDLIGKSGLQVVLAPQSQVAMAKRMKAGDIGPVECWCIRKNGDHFLSEIQSRNITYQGRPMRLVTVRDITERKKADAALAAEKERLSVTLHSIGDGVIATDTEGKIVIMNVIAESLTGWTQAEAQGRPLAEVFHIVHEISREPCENPVEKVLATGGIVELANHTVLISRDGSEHAIADSGAPIRSGDGAAMGVVLVFRDMTEKQKLIQAAQRSQKLESLGILAGGIAHDFNNLLGGIYGYIDLAQSKCKDPGLSNYLAKAMSTIERARGLTQQLLTFAKGGMPIRKTQALFPFVEETVQFVLSGTSVTSRFTFPPDLKACDFDRNQIGQVLDNLTINAQQAMPMGGTLYVNAANVAIRSRQIEGLPAGEYVRISLRDTGIGIPAEILTRIFDPFFTTKQKGSGLGLATCYSILQQHDDGIEVLSDSGKGTVFHIYLPASQSTPGSETVSAKAEMHGQGCFLIMDDEEVIRETVGEMLRIAGFEVIGFPDGQSLLHYLDAKPDGFHGLVGILLDLTVPGGMGGREVMDRIRDRSGLVPIFVSSGYGDDPVMAEPKKFGIAGSISKPFLQAELLEMLKKHL